MTPLIFLCGGMLLGAGIVGIGTVRQRIEREEYIASISVRLKVLRMENELLKQRLESVDQSEQWKSAGNVKRWWRN